MWGIISSVLLGALVGWLASIIMGKNAKMGALANIIVGIFGGVVGNFIAEQLNIATRSGWSLGGILISVLGAVILLWIVNLITGKK